MTERPLVSLILCVKNGMPYLPEALASIGRQTYDPFEVLAQDGESTDGSLEVLAEWAPRLRMSVESRADGGVGPAYTRAFLRSQGAIVGSIDADNLLEPEALERVVRRFAERPDAAALYGGAHILRADGKRLCTWHPEDHDFLRAMCCEMVPPFGTAYFSRRLCAHELGRERAMKTCGDYDLWLRLGHLPIVRTADVLGSTRMSDSSITCRPETYEQMCADKITALTAFLASQPPGFALECLARHAVAGIYLWAAESLLGLDGRSERVLAFCRLAARHDPGSPRLRRLRGGEAATSCAIDPDADRAVLLDREAHELARILEVNLYGEQREGAASLQSGTVVLRATSTQDHLATPFVSVPRKTTPDVRLLELEMAYEERVRATNATVILQDRDCRTLATIACLEGEAEVKGTVQLGVEVEAVRLVFTGAPQVVSRLPRRVRVLSV